MASSSLSVVLLLCMAAAVSAQLSPTFYASSCPGALSTIKNAVDAAVSSNPRMGASLLRLHFHDCFVQGCDASVLLAGNEQNAGGNSGSLLGLDLIQNIKDLVEAACDNNKRTVFVSCADILAVAARDSVVALGGPSWTVQLGRRDSTTASVTQANNDLPPPSLDVAGLNTRFAAKGFSLIDMVALSGAHTVGRAQCKNFRNRLYNETNIDPDYATKLQANCPQPTGSGDGNLAQLDDTPTSLNADSFDNGYFVNLQLKKGLLHSDQALYTVGAGGATENIVDSFATNPDTFRNAFASAMVKMGNLSPLTGSQGMVRRTCSSSKAN